MIIALGEKVFGALLVITGAAIILTGHWTTTDDMIADLIAGGLMLASGVLVLFDVELSALNAAPVRRGDRRLLHRPRRPAARRSVPQDRRPKTLLGLTSKDSVNSRRASMSRRRDGLRQHAGRPRHALSQPSTAGVSSLISGLLAP